MVEMEMARPNSVSVLTLAGVLRGPERVRAFLEGPPDHLAAVELQEELGLLRLCHHPHLS